MIKKNIYMYIMLGQYFRTMPIVAAHVYYFLLLKLRFLQHNKQHVVIKIPIHSFFEVVVNY